MHGVRLGKIENQRIRDTQTSKEINSSGSQRVKSDLGTEINGSSLIVPIKLEFWKC